LGGFREELQFILAWNLSEYKEVAVSCKRYWLRYFVDSLPKFNSATPGNFHATHACFQRLPSRGDNFSMAKITSAHARSALETS